MVDSHRVKEKQRNEYKKDRNRVGKSVCQQNAYSYYIKRLVCDLHLLNRALSRAGLLLSSLRLTSSQHYPAWLGLTLPTMKARNHRIVKRLYLTTIQSSWISTIKIFVQSMVWRKAQEVKKFFSGILFYSKGSPVKGMMLAALVVRMPCLKCVSEHFTLQSCHGAGQVYAQGANAGS
ncbi:hypothetical protein RRG08_058762 [Elysia crispata]|uniref:Uncharacterized protein n=1 Tax=Elysia crispata TaxID=231223 RepID=A0AAE1D5X6_9GAST|nr:hypothetical protein RRG08_058762 [Elysia crispata]